jgi:hypothetical protein
VNGPQDKPKTHKRAESHGDRIHGEHHHKPRSESRAEKPESKTDSKGDSQSQGGEKPDELSKSSEKTTPDQSSGSAPSEKVPLRTSGDKSSSDKHPLVPSDKVASSGSGASDKHPSGKRPLLPSLHLPDLYRFVLGSFFFFFPDHVRKILPILTDDKGDKDKGRRPLMKKLSVRESQVEKDTRKGSGTPPSAKPEGSGTPPPRAAPGLLPLDLLSSIRNAGGSPSGTSLSHLTESETHPGGQLGFGVETWF